MTSTQVETGEFDTDVLVVGTGPTGAAAALALATYGVRVRVATKWNWLANSPRAHITNQRSMEILRDVGIVSEVKAQADGFTVKAPAEAVKETSMPAESAQGATVASAQRRRCQPTRFDRRRRRN